MLGGSRWILLYHTISCWLQWSYSLGKPTAGVRVPFQLLPSAPPTPLTGKEGKRVDYSSFNCLSVVRMSGAANEHHGCPYKRMDEATLRTQLARMK